MEVLPPSPWARVDRRWGSWRCCRPTNRSCPTRTVAVPADRGRSVPAALQPVDPPTLRGSLWEQRV